MSDSRLLVVTFVLAAAFPLVACDGDACGHPSKATYSNLPGADGSIGCKGVAVDRGGNAAEVDDTFPVGTVVRLPMCLVAYPDSVATCTCDDVGGAAPQWVCPI